MKIIMSRTGTGSNIYGDCVMLRKGGSVYPCIDNKYHPNPGTGEDGYAEIERVIDWVLQNNLNLLNRTVENWMRARIADNISNIGSIETDDIFEDTFYCDGTYIPCDKAQAMFYKIIKEFEFDFESYESALQSDETDYSKVIADYINENFLRVRAGGKLNPDGSDSIYFRISSHGYDWHRDIADFLWDTFNDITSMPRYVWIGHDAETNPPETVLFDGNPENLFMQFDGKVFSSYKRDLNKIIASKKGLVNDDRLNARCQKLYLHTYLSANNNKYQSFM